MLAQRVLSHHSASSSQRACCPRDAGRAPGPARRPMAGRRGRADRVRRAADAGDVLQQLDDVLQGEGGEFSTPEPRVVQIRQAHNSRPDFADPEWTAQVDDWSEFWSSGAYWDERELEDLDDLDDEHDAALMLAMAPAAGGDEDDEDGAEGASAKEDNRGARGKRSRIERARALIGALHDVAKQDAAMRVLGSVVDKETLYYNAFEIPPDEVTLEDPNPHHSDLYLRAMAEKQMRREALDAEWHRRMALVGTIPSMDYTKDLRLEHDHIVRENWSHEQILELIEGNGKYAPIADVEPHAIVLNPLIPVDYHNDYGVEAIIETEDFIRSIGHLLEGRDMLRLEAEVELEEADFVDPGVAFRDEADNVYMQAPVNEWQQAARAAAATDIATLLGGDDFLATRPEGPEGIRRFGGAAGAGYSGGGGSDEEGDDDEDDLDYGGEGFLPEP
ncbi:MAG: hypothetical protein J3K34DRAFT_516778 [Monoraphidium minutum]|nr:MAG: hypothetical protein J3K34DRAFT_516778 [Monoraphidium minutum]